MEQQKRALGLLLSWLKDGVLPGGSLTIVADEIRVAHSTISRLWGQACGACKESLIITPEIAVQNHSHVNALKYSHAEFRQGLKEIPQHRRKTYHSTAKAMGNEWLNPTMDDDSDQDSDDLDDDAHVPTTTATPTVEMDGEGGENATTDEITNTGV